MPTFASKPRTVTANVWPGFNDDGTSPDPRVLEPNRPTGFPIGSGYLPTETTKEREQVVMPGDYLVEEGDQVYAVRAAVFLARYEEEE